MEKQYKYLKIGSAWNGEYGINGILDGPMHIEDKGKIKFYLFDNKKKEVGSKSPDFHLMVKNPAFDGATNPPKEDLPFR